MNQSWDELMGQMARLREGLAHEKAHLNISRPPAGWAVNCLAFVKKSQKNSGFGPICLFSARIVWYNKAVSLKACLPERSDLI